jgi:putative transposase
MKNHFHLLLSERVENGITLFLRKMTGYARYFNERHERKGVLFQARTKKVLIERHEHFLYVLHYLHLNPLDYLTGAKDWRVRDKGQVENVREALEYLQNYRWSSYLDYCGTRNFPSLITKDLFGHPRGAYEKSVCEYLTDCTEFNLDLSSLE